MGTIKHIALILVCAFLGCTSFIEVAPPKNQLLTDGAFATDETATAALLGIYIKMVDDNLTYDIPMACGYAADELYCYSNQAPLLDIYTNSPRPVDAYTNKFWNAGYFYIYQANSVIEGCLNSTGLHSEVKKQLMAEAHFIRALWMYYLVNFYGDIPMVLSTDYKTNTNLSRAPIAEVYQQIAMDLEYAIANLSPHYVNYTSRAMTEERIRPNQYAAIALLSRVRLSMGDWNQAEQLANTVIGNSALYDTVSIHQTFLKDNKEAIWQLMEPTPRAVDYSTREGFGFVLINKPQGGTSNNSAISQWLLDAFEPGDLRRETWIGEYIDNSGESSQSFYYPNKYKVKTTTSLITEQSTVLRLAEQYLIRAEARIQQGNFEDARDDLNLIRERAKLPPITANEKDDLLEAVCNERRTELFAEWGHRWIDIKRMKFANEIMLVITAEKQGGLWDSNKGLWPIPQTEVDRNTSLNQNPGYN